jgi:UDP-N-acetylglucosamine diphosphorylase / glucose-1-phosphate thymidylyltransferase / UDP-N-acetylgalactosamine diphosphorylase / glucosamine-1-phosphate N-acetyltransferase / galactosamine-1-phosphate N-acetyltransferase
VVVQAFTRIEGPCHIGHGSRLYRASIRGGTTIGPNCRVGGEVEASILQAYVNKYHDGFLGHGYVCPWVNLGAQTANSDLKSDYSPVTYPRPTGSVDTGLKKVGCFIGDHTKTGLGSLINTGTQIGVMAMLLPSGGLLPRLIPSFATVRDGAITEMFSMDRCFAAAVAAMERRNVEFTAAQRRLLQQIHQRTKPDRQAAVERAQRASEASSS